MSHIKHTLKDIFPTSIVNGFSLDLGLSGIGSGGNIEDISRCYKSYSIKREMIGMFPFKEFVILNRFWINMNRDLPTIIWEF